MTVSKRQHQKKIKLSKAGKQTKWAPFWIVVKKLGQGKKVHPSRLTRTKRNWRATKLKIKPRRLRKQHLG